MAAEIEEVICQKGVGRMGFRDVLCDQFLQGNSGVPCAGCHSQADAVPKELDDEKR